MVPPLSTADLTMVVPGDVGRPTGGNVWDRQVRAGLAAGGTGVRWRPVRGRWPVPPEGPAHLDDALAAVPAGSPVLVDGLLLAAWPEVARLHAERLRLSVVVHLPLALETGQGPAQARRLAAAEAEVLRVVAGSGAVLTTSAWCASYVRSLAGLPPAAPVVVAPPGTSRLPSPPPVRPGRDGGRLLAVGALTPRKGHDVLLAALDRLGPGAGWSVRLVGPEPTGSEPDSPDGASAGPSWSSRHVEGLRGRAAALSAAGVPVRLVGAATGPALEEQWQWADLLVVPSRAETYGMVVTEALVRGLPCLVTAGSGLVEALGAVDGEPPGLVVPPGDPEELAGALRRWREEPGLRERLGRLVARRAGRLLAHDWDATAATVRRAVVGAGA